MRGADNPLREGLVCFTVEGMDAENLGRHATGARNSRPRSQGRSLFRQYSKAPGFGILRPNFPLSLQFGARSGAVFDGDAKNY